jgi:hypothetical protein
MDMQRQRIRQEDAPHHEKRQEEKLAERKKERTAEEKRASLLQIISNSQITAVRLKVEQNQLVADIA